MAVEGIATVLELDPDSDISELFDPEVRGRAAEYRHAVTLLQKSRRHVRAAVMGTAVYTVDIRCDLESFTWSCTCPHYQQNGNNCKHIWAVLVAAQENGLLIEIPSAIPPWAGLPPAPPPTAWKEFLRPVLGSDEPPSRPVRHDSELLYLVDIGESARNKRLVIRIATRRRFKDGTWDEPRFKSVRKTEIAQLADAEDRAILSCLFGADETPYYTSYYSVSDRFCLDTGHLEMLLPRICRTGRLFPNRGEEEDDDEVAPLKWDEAGPWEFRLRLDAVGGGNKPCAFSARLRRGEESLELGLTTLLMPSGFFIAGGKVSQFRFDGDAALVSQFRRHGSLPVERKDMEFFLDELYSIPGTFEVDLPDGIHLDEVRGTPTPFLTITVDKERTNSLNVGLTFRYPGAAVDAFDPQNRVLRWKDKQLVLRDRAAEEEAMALLPPLGFRRAAGSYDDVDFRLAAMRLPHAVRELVSRGWKVEADGLAYRVPGAFRMSVNSGIDWFDLEGGVDYGGEEVPFPRLLEALRRGQNFVKLGSGGIGLLPEEWLRGKGLVLEAGEIQGEVLRFRPGQALLLDALLAAEGAASCDETFRRLRGELDRFDGVAPVDPPAEFQGKLRPYQKVGLGWAEFLRKFRMGGCLADDMGLGKTVTVLALLESRRAAKSGPSLVVVPRSLVWNWKSEAARFASSLRVVDYTGTARSRDFSGVNVVLTTYGTLRRDAPLLKDVKFDYLILDEAQAIKNSAGVTAKAARLLKGDHRLALSGTPIENHLGELWSLMEFLNPGLLGTAGVFQRTVGKDPDEATRGVLARALRPFILRRTKAQVAPELPPKMEEILTVDLDARERKRYDELRVHFQRTLLGRPVDWRKMKFNVLEALLRLRQAACHPGLIDAARRDESSAKVDVLLDRVREVLDEGHKALVFSQFTTLLGIVRGHLDREEVVYEYLDGQTRDRAARVKRFQEDPDCKLFLISLKAGGLGLNLTAAEYVFLLDPWWNPAVEAQAIDRTHRIGQDRHVFAYRIVARDTVEAKVLELQKSKRALADSIIPQEGSFLRGLTRDDVAVLLS